jgi:hypothetical protein
LISSAKSSFDKVSDDLIQTATKLVLLDSVLRHYGAPAGEARQRLKSAYANVVALLPVEGHAGRSALEEPLPLKQAEGIRTALLELKPADDTQRWLKTRALEIFSDLATERWMLMLQKQSSISAVFLVVLVFWLAMIFMAFGLLAPCNSTVVLTLLVCGLSVAGAIFLLLEMEQPLHGLMRVSNVPLQQALEHLAR